MKTHTHTHTQPATQGNYPTACSQHIHWKVIQTGGIFTSVRHSNYVLFRNSSFSKAVSCLALSTLCLVSPYSSGDESLLDNKSSIEVGWYCVEALCHGSCYNRAESASCKSKCQCHSLGLCTIASCFSLPWCLSDNWHTQSHMQLRMLLLSGFPWQHPKGTLNEIPFSRVTLTCGVGDSGEVWNG